MVCHSVLECCAPYAGGSPDAHDQFFSGDIGRYRPGAALEHSSADHIRILPAPDAEVLLKEAGGGAAVLVRGKLGKGRVYLYGAAPGYGGRPLGDAERALLRAIVAP